MLQNLLEKFNKNFSDFFKEEKSPFLREYLTLIFNDYNHEEYLGIILNLENLIKPFFTNRDKENQDFKGIDNVAKLLKEITRITHNKKINLKKILIKRRVIINGRKT